MKMFFYFLSLSLIVFFVVSVEFVGPVSAELEWKIRQQVPLTSAPLDNAVSADGQLLFMLSAGEIAVYSLTRNKTISTIPIDRDYDRISVSPKGNSLIVTSSAGKSLKIIDLERLDKDARDPTIQKLITRDVNNGIQSGVRGTPAIFVNGKRLNNRSLPGFQQAIEAELKKM